MKIATISNLDDRTIEDERTGALRSVQAADVTLPETALREIWSPMHLERLARTYWRFLTRVTLGLVRVLYSEGERSVVLLARPIKLLTFKAPEYELDSEHGVVRWRIERGLLVARRGRGAPKGHTPKGHAAASASGGQGHLQIDVRRLPDGGPGESRLHIEVEVANFHPAIASGLGRRVYNVTQARIHVFVTHGFLRSLARLDLAESKVGRLAPVETPPVSPGESQPASPDGTPRAHVDAPPR
jgi:hypothetical protein